MGRPFSVKLHAQPIELRGFHRKVHPLVGDLSSNAFEHVSKTAQLMSKSGCRCSCAALDKKSLRDFQVVRRTRDCAPGAVDSGDRIFEQMPHVPIDRTAGIDGTIRVRHSSLSLKMRGLPAIHER
jgi:hypothetical protein